MEDRVTELGRQVVANKHWRWLPGMLALIPAPHEGATGYMIRVTEGAPLESFAAGIPDMTDPATIGACMRLLREVAGYAYSRPTWSQSADSCWEVHTRAPNRKVWKAYMGKTEGEAFVFAWNAAGRTY